ncbi:MAG: ABC transporter ATP-binding protein, partial [Clostridia bacterium]|nr:ABC transporter ATP-binding protein [Clostridia bacterium]
MLKLLDITKEYIVEKESTLALKGVSIEFRKNEFVSILGPSGCGKTTLLNIIGGLDRYTSGDIQIDEISTKQYDDVDWDTYRNRKIGFVFQSYNLIPHMNILKNVAMSLTIAGVDRDERKARALEALKKVGLESQARKRPNQLSGGQMQRVAIARALVNNPDIILADEPTGALDSESGIQVMDLLKEVAEDRLVIMVTHNPMLAEEYSTRIVYLKDGAVEGDTMPYNSKEEKDNDHGDDIGGGASGGSVSLQGAESGEGEADMIAFADETPAATESVPEKKKSKSCDKWEKIKKFFKKRRQLDKTAMKLST